MKHKKQRVGIFGLVVAGDLGFLTTAASTQVYPQPGIQIKIIQFMGAILFALLATVTLLSTAPPANASLVVTSFNGTTTGNLSEYVTGTEEVMVELSCLADGFANETCVKSFYEDATAEIGWGSYGAISTLQEEVVNHTAGSWNNFLVDVGDGFEITGEDWVSMPEGATVMMDTSYFQISFATPLAYGSSFAFDITFQAMNGADHTTISQTPNVAEPATLLLMSLGLAGLGFARRRRLNT